MSEQTAPIIDTSDISLLYPDADSLRRHAAGEDIARMSQVTAEQLELYYLMDLKSCDFGSFYTADPEVILYRQSTFADMLDNPELTQVLLKMIPFLNDITELRRMGSDSAASTEAYLYSITEVELYTSLLDLLKTKLLPMAPRFKSTAFRRFAERINILTASEYYKDLNQRLTELTSRVREIKSITIGVNLDSQLRADKAGVLSMNNEYFKSGELLDKMLRLDFKSDEMTCIAPLIPFKKGQSDNQQMALANAFNTAIGDVFRSSIKAWKKVIQMYVLENTDFLIRLMPEIEFVTKATELLQRLKAKGCHLCSPVIAPMTEKKFTAKALCNPIVASKLDGPVIPNDFTFDADGMFYVLTGPNRGGKSVITCAVGIAFVMAQLGLPVCADECVISPCDEIYTHFPTGSEDTIDKGRLGEECSRLGTIFETVTEDSLILLDESFSSTGSYEGAYIAAEVLQGFSMVGCRGIFSTHLHDLAASVDEINAACLPKGGVKIDNLVAAIQEGSRSFKILRAKPDGKSYARDIAEKYGLSLDHILEKVQKH
ncbi:MAG: hypothetical protein IJB15_14480 [Clostridia bacterium]|nr:hypothetical protein [Clostridia bacterium]MBQ4607912.1 hypothetical protein [Clostridia bacterium]